MRLTIEDFSNKQIALKLGVAYQTVKNHKQAIRDFYGVQSNEAAVAKWVREQGSKRTTLTPMQSEVIGYLAAGLTDGDIAVKMDKTRVAVQSLVRSARLIYQVKTTAEAVAKWKDEQHAKSGGTSPE